MVDQYMEENNIIYGVQIDNGKELNFKAYEVESNTSETQNNWDEFYYSQQFLVKLYSRIYINILREKLNYSV